MHETPMDIAKGILQLKEDLALMKSQTKDRSFNKAKTIANYDKKIAATIIRLRNGVEMQLEGMQILNPPTTVLDKIARGICWKERLEMEEADALYKSLITNIETTKAELNGLQSINKHLE